MCQILFDTKIPLRNENFARGRMAYLVELEDDIESDVPSTLLRSVHDCPVDRSSENINADNVLINVFFYFYRIAESTN
jgi:IK cytokine